MTVVATTPTSMAATRADLVAQMTAAGIPNVTGDPRLQPPGVLVDVPDTIDTITAAAGWRVQYVVKVVAAPPGDAEAADWLLATTQQVLQVFGYGAAARVGTVTVDGKDCPAYIVTQTLTVTNPAPC